MNDPVLMAAVHRLEELTEHGKPVKPTVGEVNVVLRIALSSQRIRDRRAACG